MVFHRHRHGHHRGPWGPWNTGRRFFGQGELRLAILSLLSEEPMHGYELMNRLEERLDGTYKASAGAIYPTLQQLEDEGLLVSEKEGGKKVCRLTRQGEEEVAARKDDTEALWARANEWGQWGFINDPTMITLAKPMRQLMKSIKKTLCKTHDAATVFEVEKIITKAQAEIDELIQ